MPERLVDVEKKAGRQVSAHVSCHDQRPCWGEEAFKEKALEAAGNAKLVPNEELEGSERQDAC